MSYVFAVVVLLINHASDQHSSVEQLIAKLKSVDPKVRRMASEKLAKTHDLPEAVIGPLTDALSDSDVEVRCNSVAALKSVGRKFPKAAEGLVRALADEGAVASDAERALIELGKTALGPLRAALEKQLMPTQNATIYQILGSIGGPAKDAIPLLEKGLTGQDRFARYYAAEAIVRIDPTNKSVKGVLEEALQRPESHWQLFGAEGLARSTRFKTKEALDVLVEIITDDRAALNHLDRAIVALGHFGAAGKHALPRLEERMNDKNLGSVPDMRVLLAITIFKIDRNHDGARKVLGQNMSILRRMEKKTGNAAALEVARDVRSILSQLEDEKKSK
jgi:HEAT repeat protein